MPITVPDKFVGSPAPYIDHTLLKPETTTSLVRDLCEEAVEWGFAAVCVPPRYVPLSVECLYGSEVKVATVVGFPFGYATTDVKAFEARDAVSKGAKEIDMVMSIGAALVKDWPVVESDIRAVVMAAEGVPVKLILECSALPEDVKARAAESALAAGVSYLKTSTGYGAHGATIEDVRLLHELAQGHAGVKAAGGIRDLESCQSMLAAGATRIGTSSGVDIMRQWHELQQKA